MSEVMRSPELQSFLNADEARLLAHYDQALPAPEYRLGMRRMGAYAESLLHYTFEYPSFSTIGITADNVVTLTDNHSPHVFPKLQGLVWAGNIAAEPVSVPEHYERLQETDTLASRLLVSLESFSLDCKREEVAEAVSARLVEADPDKQEPKVIVYRRTKNEWKDDSKRRRGGIRIRLWEPSMSPTEELG